jgi:predicted O-linked N-acetylglucosamine transferase (SPINDLY family)
VSRTGAPAVAPAGDGPVLSPQLHPTGAHAVRRGDEIAAPARPTLCAVPGGRGQVAEVFTAAVRKATTQELGLADLLATVATLHDGGEAALSLELYRCWIAHNASHPLLYIVQFNYGVALSNRGDEAGAKDAFLAAIGLNKAFWPAYINLGSVLERTGAVDQAVTQWYHVVNSLAAVDGNAISYKTSALKRLGKVLEGAHYDEHAERTLRLSLEIDPNQREVLQHWISLRQVQCKWPVLTPWDGMTRKKLIDGIYPLSLATLTDDPLIQLGNAHHYNTIDVGRPSPFTAGRWPAPEAPRGRPLRIGYVSSDLRAHAVGFLASEIFELHDRAQVEIFAYYCGIAADDSTKSRIRNAVDHWIGITDLDDHQAARRIVDDGIDILVDFNGYSKDARTALFALRPAPIIVNWLGFPGTMGSPHHHYIIADDWIIPPESELYYSEKVLRLPCYQPNDRKRVIAAARPTRQEAGLPDEGVVYCCFNGLQKVTKTVFERWMTVLSQVPGSVLWFLAAAEETHERLRMLATQYGVAQDRLIFAARRNNEDHLARFSLADVFLDTLPYGAHTTASDAMWMGVPVVTVSGRGFASRVCGSLVRAAGLGELVCASLDDYVARAVELGRNKAALQACKDRLIAGRDTCTLFDTPSLVRNLETLYIEMWEDYRRGRVPEPDLTNLPIYREIGCEGDCENAGFLSRAEYHAHYRRALAYRNSGSPLPVDSRLWTDARLGDY